jgi:hypothetical protein
MRQDLCNLSDANVQTDVTGPCRQEFPPIATASIIPYFSTMRQMMLLFALVALFAAGCTTQALESRWYESTGPEQEVNYRFYHADSKTRYNVRNDSVNLYVSMDMADRLTMMKVLQTGMRLYLGSEGKKKERNELQFPLYVDKYLLTAEDLNPQTFALDMVGGTTSRLQRMLPTEGYFKLNGNVTSVYNGTMAENGVQATMRLDKDRALVYEAIIPLRLLGTASGTVALGVETGAFKMTDGEVISQTDITSGQQMTAGDRAMGRGQGVGMDPYGMNTPTGSTNMGMNQRALTRANPLEEPIRFWMTVVLARQSR